MKLRSKVTVFGLIIMVLLAVYLAVYARATMIVYHAAEEVRNNPNLWTVPVPLPETTVSKESAKTETYFGYGFDVPWKDALVKEEDAAVLILSPSRREGITFVDPAGEHGLVGMMRDTPGVWPDLVYSLYGKDNSETDFALTRAALNTSPSELSLVMPGKKQIYAANLLRMKHAYIGASKSPIYSFDLGALHGFQHADGPDSETIVDAYDQNGHKFTFIFSYLATGSGGFRQSDINRILQTFRVVDDDD